MGHLEDQESPTLDKNEVFPHHFEGKVRSCFARASENEKTPGCEKNRPS